MAKLAAILTLYSVAWSADGRTVAVGGPGVSVLIDARSHRELARVGESRGRHDVSFIPGDWLVTQGLEDTVPASWKAVLWEPRRGARQQAMSTPVACASDTEVAWGCRADGRGARARRVGFRGQVEVDRWDGARMTPAWTLAESSTVIAVSADGVVAAGGAGGASALQTEKMMVHTSGPNRAYFSKDVPKQVRGGYLRIHAGGHVRCEKLELGERIVSLTFAPSGDRVLAGDRNGDLYLLSTECELLATLRGGAAPVVDAAFGPGGRAVSIHGPGRLRWWDLVTGKPTDVGTLPVR